MINYFNETDILTGICVELLTIQTYFKLIGSLETKYFNKTDIFIELSQLSIESKIILKGSF